MGSPGGLLKSMVKPTSFVHTRPVASRSLSDAWHRRLGKRLDEMPKTGAKDMQGSSSCETSDAYTGD